ncbi:MAG: PP2C family protein-serine/threonine phosphatase [Planctomycetota bacterium]
MSTGASSHDTIARTSEFEVIAAERDPFLLVTLRGRFTDELLSVLQKHVFLQLRSLALECSALSGITMAFTRSVYYAAQTLRSQGHTLVVLSPPESFRGFLKLLGADVGRLPILLSDAQLPARASDAAAAAEKLERELQQIRRELESNALWGLVDRESCWMCPFCGELRDGIRIPSRLSIAQAAVEKVWRHLNFECRAYTAVQPRYQPREELEEKIREINQLKLAASVNRVEALQTKVQKLEEKAQWATHLEKGVKIAASRQRKLLPTRPPQVPGCDIAYTYRPAEELSGDFFDFVELGDGRVAFVIGDVSGHGIEAGILMGMTKKVLSIRLGEMGDPVAAVRKTNADLVKDMDRSSFVTAAVVVFDPAARSLVCARAGHNPPLLHNPARGSAPLKLEGSGLMLGMAAPAVFDPQLVPQSVEVRSGDVLLLYTDGLEEGKNAAGEEFGLGRIVPVLQAEGSKPAAYVLGALFYEFDRFSGGVVQEDDLTAICVKFR